MNANPRNPTLKDGILTSLVTALVAASALAGVAGIGVVLDWLHA